MVHNDKRVLGVVVNGPEEKRRKFLQGVASVGLAGVLAGCASSDGGDGETTGDETVKDRNQSQDGFEVVITHGEAVGQLDPHNHSLKQITDALSVVYEYPIFMDMSKNPAQFKPRLATEWGYVDDKTFKTKIREGVKWHNGSDLTLEDVRWTIDRIRNPDVGIAAHQQDDWTNISEMNVDESDHSIIWHMKTPDPLMEIRVGARCDIVNKQWIQENSQQYVAKHINGTGPYKLENFEQRRQVVFTKFEDWWNDDYGLLPDRIIFNAASEPATRANQLISGNTDLAPSISPEDFGRINNSERARVKQFQVDRTQFVAMNSAFEPFQSKKFRQAMNYAVDNASIVENVLQGRGTPTGQVAPPAWPGYNPNIEPYPYNPEKAQRLWQESGVGNHGLELIANFGGTPKVREVALGIANMVTQSIPGITVEVEQVDEATHDEIRHGNSNAQNPQKTRGKFWMSNTGGSPPHGAQGKIDSYIYSGGHSSAFSNEKIDELFESVKSAEPDEVDKIGQQLQKVLHEQAPWVFLYVWNGSWGLSKRVDLEPFANEDMHPWRMKRYNG